MLHTIETADILGIRVRLVALPGNHYRYSFMLNAVNHRGEAPSKDGAIAMVFDRVKACKREKNHAI